MFSRTKLGLITLLALAFLVIIALFTSGSSQTFTYEFSKTLGINSQSNGLREIVERDLQGVDGSFSVFIEELEGGEERFALNENDIFPAASLYKLILLAAVMQEIERGSLTFDTAVSATKTHLTEVLGSLDFGYEESPEYLEYTVEEAMKRIAEISDNFAAIVLTEKLQQIRQDRDDDNRLLVQMTKELGMKNTSFDSDPTSTTAYDIYLYFKQLYQGKVVSLATSEKIKELLSGSKLNNRIPAKLPEGVRVVHKTGELSRLRHDAGIVYLENKPYVIILMSKELKYEDEGVEALANISKDVYEYFKSR